MTDQASNQHRATDPHSVERKGAAGGEAPAEHGASPEPTPRPTASDFVARLAECRGLKTNKEYTDAAHRVWREIVDAGLMREVDALLLAQPLPEHRKGGAT